MEEHGVVVQRKGARVVIKAQRTGACESCASKKACHGGDSPDAELLIEAEDPVGAKVGDKVVFSVSAGSVLKAGLLLYLFPVLCFIAGVALGQALFARLLPSYNPDLVAGAVGVVLLAAAFGGIKLYGYLSDRGRSFRPHVLRVE